MDDQFNTAISGLFAEANDRDFIVVSRSITRNLHWELSAAATAYRQKENCTVFLTTNGGDPDAGYRIARCLRHHYKHVRVAVASVCKSAGTLIAIAADELGIGDLGELGPLDIQVRKPSELWENSSGLDIQQALQTVTEHVETSFHRTLVSTRNASGLSTKLCAEFAGQVASALAGPLFAQIDPIRLGEMQRATRVAYSYGQRLDKYTQNLKEGALERLISEYPAHGFVIDRKEAKELFNRVSPLTNAERVFCETIWNTVVKPSDIGPWFVQPLAPAAVTGNDNEQAEHNDQQHNEEGAANDPGRAPAEGEGNGEGGIQAAADADG